MHALCVCFKICSKVLKLTLHKIFAKTLFLGKNLIFLPQCHSTNEEAKRFSKSEHFPEGSVIWADYQEKGRGQHGNVWISEAGKNLLFTIFLKPEKLAPTDQFKLNIVLSLALCESLEALLPNHKVEIKWPNDIYCDDKKIAGILVETTINAGKIEFVYCGIGLNVNQSHFSLPNATSILSESGESMNREEVLESILMHIEKYLEGINRYSQPTAEKYLHKLRWKDEPHIFQIEGQEQVGTIIGIGSTGKLIVKMGNNRRSFDVKEIVFIE